MDENAIALRQRAGQLDDAADMMLGGLDITGKRLGNVVEVEVAMVVRSDPVRRFAAAAARSPSWPDRRRDRSKGRRTWCSTPSSACPRTRRDDALSSFSRS
jgi:hypothetical protein